MLKVIISSMIGNTLEWFEYTLYAQFVGIISKHFFPESSISEFLTWLIFAFGFFVRPLGGLFFGRIGDIKGRRSALSFSIIIMTISTAGIGLLPGYNTIGIFAPILLTFFRIMQGFSLGGEFSACICYVVEHSNKKYRGLIGSVSFIGMNLGILFGSLTARLMNSNIDKVELHEWKWRIPFVCCVFLGMVGLYIRTKVKESPIYQSIKKNNDISKSPLKEVLTKHWKPVILSMGIYVNVTSCFYTLAIYFQSMLQKNEMGFSVSDASFISVTGIVVLTIAMPLFGYISDIIGRKKLLVGGNFLLMFMVYFVFDLFKTGDLNTAIAANVVFAIILGLYLGPVPTTLVEVFPGKVRSTGIGISYNLSAAIFGGTIPVVATMLATNTGTVCSLSYYLIMTGIISTTVILCLFKESYKKDLS